MARSAYSLDVNGSTKAADLDSHGSSTNVRVSMSPSISTT
jgi:hypothetical protein